MPMKEIKIIYSCDSKGNHDCVKEEITSSRIKTFTDKMDAIHFIAECTVCTHNVKDVYPELFYWENPVDETEHSNKELEEYRINNNY
tara:strand:+ start:1015 stop:1275 length:261 start_codon:yes stop_codon:yes gene_type:complete